MTNDNFTDKIYVLKKGYINKLKTILEEFKGLSDAEAININELYLKIHTIAGTSGMYGLKKVSDVSSEFEVNLKDLKESANNVDNEELKSKLCIYVEDINNILIGE